jgi:hypothetical protein
MHYTIYGFLSRDRKIPPRKKGSLVTISSGYSEGEALRAFLSLHRANVFGPYDNPFVVIKSDEHTMVLRVDVEEIPQPPIIKEVAPIVKARIDYPRKR